ncbi:MAG: hypothetical protein KKE50_04085 [Nanoarchaeota archaeon]|nr:hypothetical protein [Nanoarchaeota archaeon]
MGWREALKINDPRWLGIGRYIAEITQRKLSEQGKDACNLTNHLRDVGNRHIELGYVKDYLSGGVSFGCFFPQFRDFLEIAASDVFRNASEEEAQRHLQSLDKYLTDSQNPDSLVMFMRYRPGEELRNHVAQLLRTKRAEAADKPYHTLELGLDPEEDTNPHMGDRRQLWRFIQDYVASWTSPVRLLPPPSEDSVDLVQHPLLYNGIVKIMQENHRESPHACYNTLVIPGSRIVVQPAYRRGRVGVTIDFLYPDGDYFDRMILGVEDGDAERFPDFYLGLDALREAYTHGTFSTLLGKGNMQPLSNICMALGMGVDEFIPVREPIESERYELHQRWVISTGGFYHAGPHIKGPQEVARKKRNRPDPAGRSEFEDDAYRINSGLTLILGLYERLPELVQEIPLLTE